MSQPARKTGIAATQELGLSSEQEEIGNDRTNPRSGFLNKNAQFTCGGLAIQRLEQQVETHAIPNHPHELCTMVTLRRTSPTLRTH